MLDSLSLAKQMSEPAVEGDTLDELYSAANRRGKARGNRVPVSGVCYRMHNSVLMETCLWSSTASTTRG